MAKLILGMQGTMRLVKGLNMGRLHGVNAIDIRITDKRIRPVFASYVRALQPERFTIIVRNNNIAACREELLMADEINADFVLPATPGGSCPKEYAKKVIAVMNAAMTQNHVILEPGIGKIPYLEQLYQSFPRDIKSRVKFNIRLVDLFVRGEVDVRAAPALRQYFSQFNHAIGSDKIASVHVGDIRGGGPVPLGHGYITNPDCHGSTLGMKYTLTYCWNNRIPIIAQFPGDIRTIETLA